MSTAEQHPAVQVVFPDVLQYLSPSAHSGEHRSNLPAFLWPPQEADTPGFQLSGITERCPKAKKPPQPLGYVQQEPQ